MRTLYIILILVFSGHILFSQDYKRPPFYQYENDPWVDSVFYSLSIDEKIGQLIMVSAFPNKGQDHREELIRYIKEYKIGGIMTMQGGPVKQANLINGLQANTAIPLLIAMDAEWGISMRVDSVLKFPYAMTLGALTDDSLIYRIGADMGKQCKRLGIHMNFAPVADVNNNPRNPVIGFRSFGDDPQNVYQKAVLIALGMQSQNILPTLKHFPGHGDTDKDSHLALPLISHSRSRLDSIELFPFREAIKRGVGGIMTAHLSIPALDSSLVPSSLSKEIIRKLLIGELGFEGLIVSDAMNMQGIAAQAKEGNADVMALAAGNDIVEFVTDPPKTIAAIKDAIRSGELTFEDINHKCRKILMVKRWLGLNKYKPVEVRNILADLNKASYKMDLCNAIQKSLTVVQNQNDLIPLKRLDTLKIAAVSIGSETINTFQKSIGRYKEVTYFNIKKDASPETIRKTLIELQKYNLVIAGVNNLGVRATNKFNLSDSQIELCGKISKKFNSIIVVFGNPYVLNYFNGIENAKGIVIAHQETNESLDLAGQLIFGAFTSEGRLPVSLNKFPTTKEAMKTAFLKRLKYTIPEEVGIDSVYLKNKIDSLVNIGLSEKAFPGCQLLMAKNGKVFFHQAYGFHSYNSDKLVQTEDLYDFASLTKIFGPLPALMRLYDEKKISLDKRVSDYWPGWKGSNKQAIILSDVLSHQARLQDWIPFWRKTVDRYGQFKPGYYSRDSSDIYSIHVSKNLYLLRTYPDSVYSAIRKSPLLKRKKYVYSDLGFIIFPRMIESLSGQNYEEYLKSNFYSRLGASTLTYNPYLYYPPDRLVPTENDQFFRREQLQGFVHDEGAAMLGGVSGNAGLFGNINDAAKVMQMYLNFGQYGGESFIKDATLKDWTSRHFETSGNRRAYGFDKPYPGNGKYKIDDAYPSPLASDESFGHTGFTGTFAWADPKSEILFLFFSNRVNPSRENNKLSRLNLRILLHQAVYQSLYHTLATGRIAMSNNSGH